MKKILLTFVIMMMMCSVGWANSVPSKQPYTIDGASGGTINGDTSVNGDLNIGNNTDTDKDIFFDGATVNSRITHDAATGYGGLIFTIEPTVSTNLNYIISPQIGVITETIVEHGHHSAVLAFCGNAEANSMICGHFVADRTADATTSFNSGITGRYFISDATINATTSVPVTGARGWSTARNSEGMSGFSAQNLSDTFTGANTFSNGDIINATVSDANCGYVIDTDYSACEVSTGTSIKLDQTIGCGGDCATCDTVVDPTACTPTASFYQPPVRQGQYITGVSGKVSSLDSVYSVVSNAAALSAENCQSLTGTLNNCSGLHVVKQTSGVANYGIVLDGDGAGSDICFGASQDSCTSNDATDNRIDIVGEGLKVTGSDPVLSACGTTPAVVGNDMAGKITIGTGATTSCTVTFATANVAAPACVVSGDNNAIGYATTTSTTVLTITSSADMDSDVISYICIGL